MSSVAMNGHDVKAGQTSRERSLGSSGTCSFDPLGTLSESGEVAISFVLSGMDGRTVRRDGFSRNFRISWKSVDVIQVSLQSA